jgi:hypothetical protein
MRPLSTGLSVRRRQTQPASAGVVRYFWLKPPQKPRLPVLVLLTALAHWEHAAVYEKLGELNWVNCKILGLLFGQGARAIWRCAVRR